jgi:hypothetical protein
MQAADYEKALLVAASWQLALNNDVNELLAIACCIRNWVVPRYGVPRLPDPRLGKLYYSSYSEAIESFLQLYPYRSLPAINEPGLIDPDEGLLVKIEQVYDCTLNDVTSSRAFAGGARYFARAGRHSSDDWFGKEILAHQQDAHPLIGTFGSQQFYV